ncbi:I78 family peptidase inhibitor [Streptomyces sp. NPDC056500]|uniref:I78 family peptidase inhibitor n=1 Tax=Streptomyces sp. NPDC056500 TaxID=3345840 RepID=UPI0036C65BB7
MASIPSSAPRPDDAPDSYVGLLAENAQERARQRGWTSVRSLPPGTMITLEYVAGRLNFEVADGRVKRCWAG